MASDPPPTPGHCRQSPTHFQKQVGWEPGWLATHHLVSEKEVMYPSLILVTVCMFWFCTHWRKSQMFQFENESEKTARTWGKELVLEVLTLSQIKTVSFHYIHLLLLLAANTRLTKSSPRPGNGCGEEAAWLPGWERNSRKRFLLPKKQLMNSSSGNGFNGSLGTGGSQPSTYLRVRCFFCDF